MPFFLLLCFTKEFSSSSVENVWLLPVEFCVASQLCVFVDLGDRCRWERLSQELPVVLALL